MRLGDSIKAVTETLGIEQCDACKERQKKLNEVGDKIAALAKRMLKQEVEK